MAGDETTGVCIMRLTEGLDEGPVALCEETPIGPDEDYGALSPRLAEIGGDLLVRALDLQAAGDLEFTEQDDERATYAEKIDRAERRLDPARPAEELARTVRALNPHIRTYLELPGDERLGVRAARRRPSASWSRGARGRRRGPLPRLRRRCPAARPRPAARRAPAPAADYLRGHTPPARAA